MISTARVISTATISTPLTGTSSLLILLKMLGNRPSSEAALALCAVSRIQPPSEPAAPMKAHRLTSAPPQPPTALAAASANGASETCRSALGTMPMITEELAM